MAGDLEVRCEVIYRRVKNPRIELRFDSLPYILPVYRFMEVLSSRMTGSRGRSMSSMRCLRGHLIWNWSTGGIRS